MAAAGTSVSSATRSRSYCRLSRSRMTTTSGMIGRITQASPEPGDGHDQHDRPRQDGADAVGQDAPHQPFSRLRRWCLVMPDCDMVKPVNTEMA